MAYRSSWIWPALLAWVLLWSGWECAAHAQTPPAVGERGVAVATPAIPRPLQTPCVAPLFTGVRFDPRGDATAMSAHPEHWSYTPPADCPGPWALVVLEADFSVSAGRQYDRTASLWLGGVNLYYGTTQEPGAKVAPSWHVERDLTAYAALFRRAGMGQTILNNWVDARYTGMIRGNARLLFYPATPGAPAPPAADAVYGLSSDSGGAPFDAQDEQQALARTLALPRNVERAYLDIIAQSQATDEQWYMCIDAADLEPSKEYSLGPPASGDPLEQCGNGNYREVEVTVDGQPAGLAPVYPWTYTGGVDPHLWRPVPDIQTLNFVPWRMDLTPFAGLLDDGRPHTVAVRVLGAHHFFSLAANLLVYADHGAAVLSGRVTRNTLANALPVPSVSRRWTGDTQGVVTTRAGDGYRIAGVLQTSHGPVTSEVAQRATYRNRQTFLHRDAVSYHQVIQMEVDTRDTITRVAAGRRVEETRDVHYPLLVDVAKHVGTGGAFTAAIHMRQGYALDTTAASTGRPPAWSKLHELRDAYDTADFNAEGTSIRNSRDQHGFVSYSFENSSGSCYSRRIDVRDEAVAAVLDGAGCPNDRNRWVWQP